MNELDNLVKIQQTTNENSDIRLPILEITNSGYYPATIKDMAIIRQEIIERAKSALPRENIYIRQKSLYNLSEREIIEKIPPWLFQEFFQNHKIKWETNERQETTQKNGFVKIKNIRRFVDDVVDLKILSSEIQNFTITKTIIDNDLIPELTWKNEVSTHNSFTPDMPILDSITTDYASKEFEHWRQWMQAKEPNQWHFFEMILDLFCFSNIKKNAERKICVGIGANGGGKGSMVKMLECIPNCRRPDQFGAVAFEAEYRSHEIFKTGSGLSVCHEFPLTSKLDTAAIGLIKSATRGETLAVRNVGSASKEIKFWGGIVLFTNHMQESKIALNSAHRYFSEWLAYDRFNIVFFDWLFKYPRKNQIMEIISDANSKLSKAFGIELWNYANKNKENPIPFYPIPETFKGEGAGEYTTRYETWLENVLEAWGEFNLRLDDLVFEGQYPALEEQQKLAIIHFSSLFKEKSLLAKEFMITEKTEKGVKIKSVFTASTIVQCIQKMGGSRKWQIPPSLTGYITRSTDGSANARIKTITFLGAAYLSSNN
jgi:hypothetical protein